MKTVKDVFGADSGASINLGWNGREEDYLSSAARFSATMVRLTALTGLQWYYDTEDRRSRRANFVAVPTAPDVLAGILRDNPHPDWGETATSFSALLSADPAAGLQTAARISAAVGSPPDRWNAMNLGLSDDFPLGDASEAAALFADLVRIWQPDHAQLGTTAMYASLPLTRAAYVSWSSSKAYTEPESEKEISIPFGDGTLNIARDWTVEGIIALNGELAAAGAPKASSRPKKQDPPQFPADGPDLSALASLHS